jgi:manganese/iron transport system ATP-binding protein
MATTTLAPLSLSAINVAVTYPNGLTALRDASFRLAGGTICALVGVNGSGKSTLFKALMGFVTPTTGRVEIDGRPVREAQKQSWVAYVPQAEEVDWTFPVSVHDVVMMGRYGYMNFLRIASAADRSAVENSLRRVGMWDYRDRQIGELSGGQKKRVFVARALAQAGRVILLDEPFTGVDVGTEEAIVSLLRELRDEGRLFLVSTHKSCSSTAPCSPTARPPRFSPPKISRARSAAPSVSSISPSPPSTTTTAAPSPSSPTTSGLSCSASVGTSNTSTAPAASNSCPTAKKNRKGKVNVPIRRGARASSPPRRPPPRPCSPPCSPRSTTTTWSPPCGRVRSSAASAGCFPVS